jgi:hypothetical protein
VLEGKTGIVFQLGDIDRCARFLRQVCEDRALLAEMGRNASDLIQYFSFSHIVDSVAQVMGLPAEKESGHPQQARGAAYPFL